MKTSARKTTRRILTGSIALAAAILLLPSPAAQAAAINWGAATTISGDTNVLNPGAFSYAYDLSNSAQTVNGVAFTGASSTTVLGTNVTLAGFGGNFGGFEAANAGLSAAYKAVLTGGDYANGATPVTVTLKALTSGHVYASQVWVDDSRAGLLGRTETVTGGGGNTVTLSYTNSNAAGGLGQYTIGRFTADATTQAFTLTGNASTQLNAIQVRDVTNIGNWVGTGGATWDASTTNNFASNAFNAPLTTTTFAAASAPLNSVTFADTYWDNGATSAVTQTAVTVAAGGVSTGTVYFDNSAVDYTISSADATGITGSTALVKSGTGTVTLSGANSYTGGTTVSQGTLTVGAGGTLGAITGALTVINLNATAAGTATIVNLNTTAGTTTGSLSGSISTPTSGTNTATINNGGQLLTVNQTTAGTYAGVIAGNGGLTLGASSTNTLTLSGANTYTGDTTISAGTLQIGAGGTTGSLYSPTFTLNGNLTFGSTGAIVDNGALVCNNVNGALNVNRTISGTGTVSVTGSGYVNFANGTTINTTGSQTYSATGSGRYQGFNLTDNATVTLTSTAGNISMTGYLGTANGPTGNLNINTNAGNGNVTLNTPTSIPNVDYGLNTLNVNAGTGTISLGAYNGQNWNQITTITLTGGAVNSTANMTAFTTLNVANSLASTFSGNLTAAGGALVKTGAGTLTLNGTNTYTGATSVNQGTLFITPTSSIGNNSVTTLNGGTLAIASGAAPRTVANNLVLNGGTLQGGFQDNYGSGGTITNDGTNVTHVFTSSGTLTVPVAIAGASALVVGGGAGGVGKSGSYYGAGGGGGDVQNLTGLSLNASNAVTVGAGGTGNNAGTVGGVGAGGSSSLTGAVVSTASGGATTTGTPITNQGVAGGASGNSNAGGTAGAGSSGASAGGGGAGGVGSNAATNTGGNGGAGALNTAITGFTGSAGGYFGGGGGGGGATTLGTGGIGGGGTNAAGTANTGGGGGSVSNGGSGIVVVQYAYNPYALAGTLILSGTIDLQTASTLDASRNGGLIDVTGVIGTTTGAGGLSISSSNSAGGVVRFSNAMTYLGATTTNTGATLSLGDGTTGHDGTIAASSGITNNGTLIYNRFGNLSSNVAISGSGAVIVSGTGSQTLTAVNGYIGATTINTGATLSLGDGTTGNDGTIAGSSGITNNGTLIYNRFGDLSSSASITGNGAVTKLGAGSQTLTAANMYSGPTLVSAGTLVAGNLTGSATGTGTVTVDAGTLASATTGGSILGPVVGGSASHVFAPGGVGTIGNFSLGSTLALNANSTLNFDINGTANTSDLLAVTGVLSATGTPAITLATTGSLTASSYILATFASSSVTNSSFSLPTAPSGYNWQVNATNIGLVSAAVASTNGVWNVNASGSWNTAGNWSGGVPGLSGSSAGNDTATFAAAATSVNPVVTLDGVSPVLKGVTFNNATQSYTIAQGTGGTLTLNGGASPSTIDVTNGSHTISAPLTLATNTNITLANAGSQTLSGAQAWSGHNVAVSGAGTVTISGTQTNTSPATFTVNSGVTANINTDGGTGLSLVNSGTVNLKSSQNLGGLTINSGAHTNITTNTAQPVATGPSVVVTPTLTIASHVVSGNTIWDGYLDLANNKLVVQTGGLSGTALQDAVKQVASQVKSGYNLANGSSTLWMGTGIGSSSAAADTRRIVGLAVFQNNTKSFGSLDGTVSDGTGNAFITSFGTATVAKNDTLVKFTYFGDTDLDGVITAGDYANIDLAFAHQQTLGPQTGWANGDFDYDGSITAADYSLMDSAFAAQSGILSGEVHTLGSLGGSPGSVTAVPEPSTWLLGLMGIIGLLAMARRRRLATAE